jgi:hypothetical protein
MGPIGRFFADNGMEEFLSRVQAQSTKMRLNVWRDLPGPILGVSTRWKHLHLPVPEALKTVCFPPCEKHLISCGKKFVGESQPEIDNNFSATRPPIVCEETKISGTTAEYIQKILERAPTFSRTASHRGDPNEPPPKSCTNRR